MASILPAQELERLVSEQELVSRWPEGVDVNKRIQAASIDLSVGSIITPEGEVISEDMHLLPPGGMAVILTHEELCLPDDIAGTVFAPNALSLRGLLVLNPGHLDPGTKSPITARVINFRRVFAVIRVGEPLLTVVFDRLSDATDKPYPAARSRREYERELLDAAPATMAGTIDEFFKENIAAGLKKEFLSKSEALVTFGSYLWVLLVVFVGVDKIRQAVGQGGTLPEPWAFYREAAAGLFLGLAALWGAGKIVNGIISWAAGIRRRWKTE